MKKAFLLFLFVLSLHLLKAQLYIQPQVGYLFSIKPKYMEFDHSDNTFEIKYGQGVSYNLSLGYQFPRNFILELNINKQMAKEYHEFNDYFNRIWYRLQNLNDLVGSIDYESKSHYFSALIGHHFYLNRFTFSLKIGPNILYSKFKLSNSRNTQAYFWDDETLGIYTLNIDNKPSWGYSAKMSIKYSITPYILVSIEVIGNSNKTRIDELTETMPNYRLGLITVHPDDYSLVEDETMNFSRMGVFGGICFKIANKKPTFTE